MISQLSRSCFFEWNGPVGQETGRKVCLDMKKYKQNVRCANCGKIVELERIASIYVPDMELDGKPAAIEQIPQIEVCPFCGYKNVDLSCRRSADPFENANFALVSYWHAIWEGNMEEADRLCHEAIRLFDEGLEYKVDAKNLLVYIDLLRKTADFDTAEKIANAFMEGFETHKDSDEILYKVFQLEKRLIKEKDSNAHFVSEAVQ